MLKDLYEVNSRGADIEIADVSGLAPFTYGLRYSAPARGGRTIVHIGMLPPESHQVFVCAQSCLRGVVPSTAELNNSHRFPAISVDEDSALEGNREEIIIRGVTHILEEMPKLPKAFLLFTSRIHHFLGTGMRLVSGGLDRRLPQVGFVQCRMNPIIRKTKMPLDPFTRKQLYSLLRPAEISEKQVNITGNNLAVRRSSESCRILEENGFALEDICTCRDFEEYRAVAEGCLNIVIHPLGRPAAQELEERLGQRWMYLPASYNWDEISGRWKCLSDLLNLDSKKVWRDMEADRPQQAVEHALRTLARTLPDWSVVIDYTISSCPLGMARFLVMCGFKVERIYADIISSEEANVLEWLKIYCPRILVCSTVYHRMAVPPKTFCEEKSGKVLAMGQKAAYFAGMGHFVNMVEDEGLYGHGGTLELADLMEEAVREEKGTEKLIQVKRWGCCR